MKKEQKDTIIKALGEKLAAYPHLYLVDVTGLNAEDTSSLRRKCFAKEVKMVVVKNSLLHRAFEASDIDYSPLYESLKGTTALMLTNTANVPGKLLKEFKDDEKPSLRAAYVEESFYIGADKLDELASLKSKEELIGEVITLLQSPVKNVVSALKSGENTLQGVLKTLGNRPEK
nr:50S ribosomal protein L10 [uncultured Prevotella sp.]